MHRLYVHRLFKRLLANLESSQSTQARPRSTVLPGKCGFAAGKRFREGGVDSPLAPGGPPPTPAVQASRFSAGAEQIQELPLGLQRLRGTGSASSLPRPHSIAPLYGKIRAVLSKKEGRLREEWKHKRKEGADLPGRQTVSPAGACCALGESCSPRRRAGWTRGQWGEKLQFSRDDLVQFS